MLERGERAQIRRHVLVAHAEREHGGCHGQRVRRVVLAQDPQLVGTPCGVLSPPSATRSVPSYRARGIVAAACGAHVAADALGRAHRHVREAAPVLAQRAQAAHLGAHDVVRRVEHGHGPRHPGRFASSLSFASRYASKLRCQCRWSGVMFSSTATFGAKRTVDASW